MQKKWTQTKIHTQMYIWTLSLNFGENRRGYLSMTKHRGINTIDFMNGQSWCEMQFSFSSKLRGLGIKSNNLSLFGVNAKPLNFIFCSGIAFCQNMKILFSISISLLLFAYTFGILGRTSCDVWINQPLSTSLRRTYWMII